MKLTFFTSEGTRALRKRLISYWESQKIPEKLRIGGVTMTPKTNYVYLWRHQETPNNSITNPESFLKIVCLEISTCRKSQILKMLQEMWAGNIEDMSNAFFQILNMRSISSKKHEMEDIGNLKYGINIYPEPWNGNLVIWDQHLPRQHKMEIW